MPSNHLILCCPFLLLLSIFPNIRVFSDESALHIRWPRYWSISISPSIEYSGLISFRIDWFDLLAVQRLSRVLIIVWHLETISFSLVWSVILFFVLDVVRLAENQHKPFPKGSHVDNLWSQLSTVETSFFEALWKGREKERKRERKEERKKRRNSASIPLLLVGRWEWGTEYFVRKRKGKSVYFSSRLISESTNLFYSKPGPSTELVVSATTGF